MKLDHEINLIENLEMKNVLRCAFCKIYIDSTFHSIKLSFNKIFYLTNYFTGP